jgi:hypothetical protein
VDLERGMRCVIRDTGAAGADRYRWTVTVFRDIDPVASGRTGEQPADARSRAERALVAYAEGGCVPRWERVD